MTTPERTERQQVFEVEMMEAFPKYFNFELFPNGMYRDELTRHTFAGWEVGRYGIAK